MKQCSQKYPKEMESVFTKITQLTDAFCEKQLNEEYKELARELTAALCRKHPSPLVTGSANGWASGIIHALGCVNFLFDPRQKPHVTSSGIASAFGIALNTSSSYSKKIRDLFSMSYYDMDWTLPSKMDKIPLVWMVTINGLPVDIRYMPIEWQEAAYMKGLIPYIPALKEQETKEKKETE